MFKNKTILITGGTGSFGIALIKFILKKNFSFKEIRVFSRDEKKQGDLRNLFSTKKINFFIGDVRDKDSLSNPMQNVDYIFHAAALKQVPSCEFYPIESVKTNIIGTENVLECAIKNKVKKVVCLSTDKAVYPINAMGISKALMEKVAISKTIKNKSGTKICITRYGNVLGTRGSIIPLLTNQILKNRPITITDGKMTRFLMSMDEAINLVLYALKKGKNGHIYVPKSSSSNIETIVDAVKKIYNKKKYPIRKIGIRHGEKMNESLMLEEEMLRARDLGKYYEIPNDNRGLNYSLYYNKGKKIRQPMRSYNSNNVKILNLLEVEKKIKIFLSEKE